MKNIHLIPTDKPSRLWTNNLRRRLELDEFPSQHPTNIAKHIYITSDEEIKEGVNQWYLDKFLNKPYNSGGAQYSSKQDVIIMTTDQDLIKDGVQAIDDEFLQWFVKNPSCEEVEVQCRYNFYAGKDLTHYKIIIPKEEPTAYHYLSCCRSIEECHCGKYPKQELERGITITHVGKQETLEEVAVNCWAEGAWDNRDSFTDGFVQGAKWQQERRYSEEEVKQMFNRYNEFIAHHDPEEWQLWIDKQFKKK